jgi:hypothetical protein
MDSSDLSKEQCRIIWEQLGPSLRYFHALNERVRQQAFPPDDEFRRDVEAAYNAVHKLSVTVHYLGCGHGVGRRPRETR